MNNTRLLTLFTILLSPFIIGCSSFLGEDDSDNSPYYDEADPNANLESELVQFCDSGSYWEYDSIIKFKEIYKGDSTAYYRFDFSEGSYSGNYDSKLNTYELSYHSGFASSQIFANRIDSNGNIMYSPYQCIRDTIIYLNHGPNRLWDAKILGFDSLDIAKLKNDLDTLSVSDCKTLHLHSYQINSVEGLTGFTPKENLGETKCESEYEPEVFINTIESGHYTNTFTNSSKAKHEPRSSSLFIDGLSFKDKLGQKIPIKVNIQNRRGFDTTITVPVQIVE